MSWFLRKTKGIQTPTKEKKDVPDGLWYKTPNGKIIHMRELKSNAYVSPDDGYHVRIGSREYFEILFDNNKFTELNEKMTSGDPLKFVDSKPYVSRIRSSIKKTELNEAIRTAYGKMNDIPVVIGCMDFTFIGGSMGSVVGEKIARAIDYALNKKIPLIIISKSGGARMMEAGYSLMQMAKTSAKLALLSEARIPYISLMTDPTTGGVTASFAMLGDFNIAEPEALIGFAGPRVIRETIGKDLPKGFQTSEFLLDNGFLDFIVDRRKLKTTLTTLLNMLKK
ncbi:MAG: acetyl-CoA carboxylase carboxyltransferase subunit beta [Cyclobacteriaceae bacterium]|nr:acetyl-CoA carboxylase carboxyltransferase subunit beta [Cyclobacteriaceae bacterium]